MWVLMHCTMFLDFFVYKLEAPPQCSDLSGLQTKMGKFCMEPDVRKLPFLWMYLLFERFTPAALGEY